MSDITQACADLAAWLPVTQALLAEPDVEPSPHRAQPVSAPPWNPAAAAAYTDAREFARRAEATARTIVTGHPGTRRGGSDANTAAALDSLARLSHALPPCPPPAYDDQDKRKPCPCPACQIRQRLAGLVTAAMALPAIDLAEVARTIRRACPYCAQGTVRVVMSGKHEGTITCVRYRLCADANGNHPRGVIARSQLDANWHVYWNDGAVT